MAKPSRKTLCYEGEENEKQPLHPQKVTALETSEPSKTNSVGNLAWEAVSRIVEWGVPSLCYHCEAPVSPSMRLPLCSSCAEISWKEPRCTRCGNRCHPSELKTARCYHCKDVSLPQTSVKSLGPYQNWLRMAIVKAKYSQDPVCLRYLRDRVEEGWDRDVPGTITFIPSHPLRLKERRARKQHLPDFFHRKGRLGPLENLLERVHFSKAQVHLRGDERRKSKENFFRYIGPEPCPREVTIFDDVWTTGATARQAAETLKRAGARRVHIRVLTMSAFETRS